jgi:hypothetical protein
MTSGNGVSHITDIMTEQVWISTRLYKSKTIIEMKQTFGLISILALQRLWCFAKQQDQSGKLEGNFLEDFRQYLTDSAFDEDEFNEYATLLTHEWTDWLVKHNLLEETESGYQIVFGLVYFEQPTERKEVDDK